MDLNHDDKGQLILKCPFCVIVLAKKEPNFFMNFSPISKLTDLYQTDTLLMNEPTFEIMTLILLQQFEE